jgi:hypothetical protein
MISKRLVLDQDRQERFRAGIDKAALLEEPGIHMVEQRRRSRRHVDQLPLLRGKIGFASQGVR